MEVDGGEILKLENGSPTASCWAGLLPSAENLWLPLRKEHRDWGGTIAGPYKQTVQLDDVCVVVLVVVWPGTVLGLGAS